VFDSLRAIPDKHKVSEAIDILIAGADTTASTLTTGLYHILSNPEIKERLIQAIDDAMPESGSLVPLQTLEKVEYLVGGYNIWLSSMPNC
jgi:cytochrome P450